MYRFSAWGPDRFGLDSGVAGEALGVLPGEDENYHPWPQMAVASLALPAACRGAYAARSSTGSVQIFAGTATKLYKFAGTGTAWTDVTRSAGGDYAVATDRYWSWAQFGDQLMVTNGADVIQEIEVNSGTNFAALGGTPGTAYYIKVVGPFLMLFDTATSRLAVKWSGREDHDFFTAYDKDSDSQTLPDGGFVQGGTALEQEGLIIQTEAVRRFRAVADRRVFEFYRIEDAQGTRSPYSIISDRGAAFYYGLNGFASVGLDGQTNNIGKDWVDEWFLAHINGSRRTAIIGARDPARRRFFWIAPSSGNASSTTLDMAICFDPGSKVPWTHADLNTEFIFPAATTATTLENLGSAGLGYTLETVPYSLDADIWKGGEPRLGTFDSAHKMNFFTGSPMAATLQTALFKPIPGRRFYTNGFRFLGDAATVSGRMSATERPGVTPSFTASNTINDQGVIHLRTSGQYARAEVTIPAGEPWTHASGIDMDNDLISEDGER
jgi:hypothetical protein